MTTVVLCCLGLVALAIGIPISIAYRRSSRCNLRLKKAVEIAVHYPDLDPAQPAPTVERPARFYRRSPDDSQSIARLVSFADLQRGGVSVADICCTHPLFKYPRAILLGAERIGIAGDVPACAECVSAFLVKHGIRCAACKRFLIPGDDLAATEPGQAVSSAYEHFRAGCCDDVIRYCGVWGMGKLIPLNVMYPGAFPEGDRVTLGHSPFSHRRRQSGSS